VKGPSSKTSAFTVVEKLGINRQGKRNGRPANEILDQLPLFVKGTQTVIFLRGWRPNDKKGKGDVFWGGAACPADLGRRVKMVSIEGKRED